MTSATLSNSLEDTLTETSKQGFIPIFVKDEMDPKKQVEACVNAGMNVIEYTLRRDDCRDMIPWIKNNFPNLKLLVGSTLDDSKIINRLKSKLPHLMTLEELDDIGVDGFVSILKFSDSTIKKYKSSKVLIPAAHSANEAYDLVSAGAHFVKVLGNNTDLLATITSVAAHGFCPLFVSGGVTIEKIPAYRDMGVNVLSAGFDVILKGQDNNVSVDEITNILGRYLAYYK